MKKILLCICVIFVLFGMVGCKKEVYEGDITGFSYHYGSFNGGYYDYDITSKDGVFHFVAKGMNGVDLNIDKDIDSAEIEKLSKIIDQYQLTSWNGFDKSDNSIMDGYSFSLNIYYSDGKKVKASGYMKYPKNYTKAHDALEVYFKDLTK